MVRRMNQRNVCADLQCPFCQAEPPFPETPVLMQEVDTDGPPGRFVRLFCGQCRNDWWVLADDQLVQARAY